MFQADLARRVRHERRILHAFGGDFVSTPLRMGLGVFAGKFHFLRLRAVGGSADVAYCVVDGSRLDRSAAPPHRERGAGHHDAHVSGIAVANAFVTRIENVPHPLARARIDDDMVRVSLRSVDEKAVYAIERRFHRTPDKTGPVRRNLETSDNVGMVLEIDHHDFLLRQRTLEAYDLHHRVGRTDGTGDFRVFHSGIGAHRAVFHPVAADERMTIEIRAPERDLRRRKIGDGRLRGFGRPCCQQPRICFDRRQLGLGYADG